MLEDSCFSFSRLSIELIIFWIDTRDIEGFNKFNQLHKSQKALNSGTPTKQWKISFYALLNINIISNFRYSLAAVSHNPKKKFTAKLIKN